MKRCPSCRQTYDDDALNFCLSDGSRLVPVESASSDTAPTLIASFPPVNQTTPQQPPRSTTPGNWNMPNPAPWTNPAYQQQLPAPKRSALPWILGGLAVLLIGGVALIFALASRNSNNEALSNSNKTSNSYANTNGNANRSSNGSANANNSNANANNSNNSNANRSADSGDIINRNANSNGNANNNSNTNSDSSIAPTNHDEVLADLRRLEDKWNRANVEGDKAALNSVLADDYRDSSGDKKKYLATLKPNPNIVSQTISNLDLSLSGNRATLRGINSVTFAKGSPARYRFTDTYIWRNGRWQAIGATSERIK